METAKGHVANGPAVWLAAACVTGVSGAGA